MARTLKKVREMPQPTVDQLAKGYLELSSQIEALEREKSRLRAAIFAELDRLGVEKIQAGEYRIVRSTSERSTLSKEKLLELGVAPHVIAQATVYSQYQRLLVTRVEAEADETPANK